MPDRVVRELPFARIMPECNLVPSCSICVFADAVISFRFNDDGLIRGDESRGGAQRSH